MRRERKTDPTAISPSFWRRAIGIWRRRTRERAALARMSAAELRDIGLTRNDRWREINKPFWRE